MGSIDFRCLTISAGEGKREQDSDSGRYRRVYYVTVQSDSTNVRRSFRFHDSIHAEETGKRGLAGDELLWAFRCFCEDALSGSTSFHDFCMECGYDEDSRMAHSIFQACQAARKKFDALWHSPTDPSDIINALSEMGIE